MAVSVVIDSSLVIAAVLPEPITSRARNLIFAWQSQHTRLASSPLLQFEVVAVMRKAVYRGRLTLDEAIARRDALLQLPFQYYMDESLLKRAFDLATLHNRPTAYDSQYLAVAERLNCEFWTGDERLYNALQTSVAWIKWVGDPNL